MRTINILLVVLGITMVLTTMHVYPSFFQDKIVDTDTPCMSAGLPISECISHDMAYQICEDLNLTYDYEAEGYASSDFCY